MEFIELNGIPPELKRELLKKLGYDIDNEGYVTKDGKRVIDKYADKPVKFSNIAILPGSTVAIDDNPVSIASYFEEHAEIS